MKSAKPYKGDHLQLDYGSVDLIKGYARASVIAFVVMVASECSVDTEWDKILPFTEFLDRAFLLPAHVAGHQF